MRSSVPPQPLAAMAPVYLPSTSILVQKYSPFHRWIRYYTSNKRTSQRDIRNDSLRIRFDNDTLSIQYDLNGSGRSLGKRLHTHFKQFLLGGINLNGSCYINRRVWIW